MELPFEKTVCRYWKQKLYTLENREETQELRLPDSMPDVGRVISSWGQVILRGKDWRDRGVGVSGGVMVWVLYSPEDGGALQRLESWIPFQVRADFPEPGEDGVIRVEPFLVSVDARPASSRRLVLRTGVGLMIQAMVPDEMELFRLGELPDDLETKVERYPFVLTREAGEKSFLVDEDLTLPDRMGAVEQLVYYRMEPEILEQKVLGSKAAFRGLGHLHLLYIDPDGRLNSHDFRVPFGQYVDLDGEYEEEAQISCLLCVTSLELDPGQEGTIRLKCGMVAQYMVNSQENVELLQDCYSPVREVLLEKQLVSVPAWLDQQTRHLELSGTVSGGEGQPVDLIFLPDPPDVKLRSGAADLEQAGTFRTLMQDSAGQYNARADRASQNVHMDTECQTVCFSSGNGAVNIRQEGASWRTDTQVALDLKSLCVRPMEMVTGVKIGEARIPDPERPSVIIRCRNRDESLWDMAKRYGSTVSAIRRINRLEGEPEQERLLLIPVL